MRVCTAEHSSLSLFCKPYKAARLPMPISHHAHTLHTLRTLSDSEEDENIANTKGVRSGRYAFVFVVHTLARTPYLSLSLSLSLSQ